VGLKKFFVDLLPGPLIRFFARPYVGGYSIPKAIEKADKLWEMDKIMTTLDLLGESVNDKETVEFNVKTYLDIIDEIKDKREYITVSIKLTAFGILFDEELAYQSVEKIVAKGHENNILVTLDMEDHPYTDITLKIYKELLTKYPTFGTVLQSRLYRTKNDLEDLYNHPNKIRIRMCIGIYDEPEEISLQKKNDMKDKMLEYSIDLMEKRHYTEYATHDKAYIDKYVEVLKEKNLPVENTEVQHLLGVPLLKIQRNLIEQGINVRLYLPFVLNKKDATAYLRRRMYHNPYMAIYVIRNLLRIN
jgi:proline dehydrogenase